MFWVGLDVLFVVVVAELTTGTLSAFATSNMPLNKNKNVSRFIILLFPSLSLVSFVWKLLSALQCDPGAFQGPGQPTKHLRNSMLRATVNVGVRLERTAVGNAFLECWK